MRDVISDYSDTSNVRHELSTLGNEATALALSGDENDKHTDDVDATKIVENQKRRRKFVLKELVETEEAYVRDLALITEGYIPTMQDPDCEIPMPDALKDGRDKMVFGNIEAIYTFHRE